ncbi:MAG: tRNA pseudouridine(55) synthase TruB [Puniceicoccales bacterium]|jgi:tRNA pseudouridine55 synthase|nr:tRNA pseudouridine(55) synthase TruB [Puniceicoccales bacterium]
MRGILLVDKPLGFSSAGAVARLRRHLGKAVRMGHCGTLDPLATGLLVLLLGPTTKRSASITQDDKTYEATVRFGFSTEGDDREGLPVHWGHFFQLARESIVKVLTTFVGDLLQRPPVFSAKKICGVPSYRLARRGIAAPGEPRPITIHSIGDVRWAAPLLSFSVHCSKGTYVRSLARDLGKALGCPAHLHALRRTRSGPFLLSVAHRLCDLKSLAPEKLAQLAEETEAQFFPSSAHDPVAGRPPRFPVYSGAE